MCGIVTFIHNNSQLSEKSIADAVVSLRHRGPDHQGYYVNESRTVGLGATRLKLVDTSDKSNQPLNLEGCVVVFNGEIYNFLELRSQLQREGVVFQTSGDTEVIIQGYRTWGITKTLKKLRGSFVFILYDIQKNYVYVARDIFGERQLVYTQTKKGNWLFASETKALAHHNDISLQPNTNALSEFIIMGFFADPEKTFFQNIYNFPPAQVLALNLSTNESRWSTYWRAEDFKLDVHSSREQQTQRLLKLLSDSVAMQLHADVPVGSILSGGIDSSLISLLALEHMQNNTELTCITASYKKGGYQDKRFVKILSDTHDRLKVFEATYPEEISDELLHTITRSLEGPIADPVEVAMYSNYALAHKLGYKTVINGQGSDELWLGYLNTYDFLRRKKVGNPQKLITDFFSNNHAFSGIEELRSANSYFRNIIIANIEKYYKNNPDQSYVDNTVHYFFATYLKGQLRNEDRLSMASSIELRLPFMYQELVELAFEIPSGTKIHNGQSKAIVRDAGKSILPYSLYKRAKTPFPMPNIKFMSQLNKNEYKFKAIKSPIVQEVVQASLNTLDRIYADLPKGSRWFIYMLSIFEKEFKL